MGFAAAPFGASAAVPSSLPVGVGSGGVAVVVALVVILGTFYLSEATERPKSGVRTTLAAVVIPLALTFASIVLFEAFAAV